MSDKPSRLPDRGTEHAAIISYGFVVGPATCCEGPLDVPQPDGELIRGTLMSGLGRNAC